MPVLGTFLMRICLHSTHIVSLGAANYTAQDTSPVIISVLLFSFYTQDRALRIDKPITLR